MTLKVDLKDPSATASGARKAGSTGATRPSGRSAGAKPPAAGRKRQRRGGIERPGTLPKRNVSPRSLGATRSEPRLQTNQVETNRQPEAQGIGANCPERARSGHRKVPATPKKRSGGGGIAPRPDQSREHRPPPRRGLVPPGTWCWGEVEVEAGGIECPTPERFEKIRAGSGAVGVQTRPKSAVSCRKVVRIDESKSGPLPGTPAGASVQGQRRRPG
jgi:hypothetical protein